MGLFDKVLEKLGLREDEEEASDRTEAKASAKEFAAEAEEWKQKQKRKAISEVDVVSQLEERAAKTPQDLNWRTSIVDLLKLLDLDSSYEARREMAQELGIPSEKLDDSAEMNVWLHNEVMKRIAENGGNVPQELID